MNKTNKLFLYLLIALFVETIAMAMVYGTYIEAFIVGLPTMAMRLLYCPVACATSSATLTIQRK